MIPYDHRQEGLRKRIAKLMLSMRIKQELKYPGVGEFRMGNAKQIKDVKFFEQAFESDNVSYMCFDNRQLLNYIGHDFHPPLLNCSALNRLFPRFVRSPISYLLSVY